MSEFKDKIIELEDGNEYYVVEVISLSEREYFYISKLNPEKGEDCRFVEYKDERVFPVLDDEIVKKLLLILYRNNKDATF